MYNVQLKIINSWFTGKLTLLSSSSSLDSQHFIRNISLSSRSCIGCWVQHETPEEGQRTYRLKHEYNNEDETNSLNILSDKNYSKRLLEVYLFMSSNNNNNVDNNNGICTTQYPSWSMRHTNSQPDDQTW